MIFDDKVRVEDDPRSGSGSISNRPLCAQRRVTLLPALSASGFSDYLILKFGAVPSRWAEWQPPQVP